MAHMDRQEAVRYAEIARAELRGRLLAKYASINAIAKALDVPYKSAYRYLTVETDQREVPFWFLVLSLRLLGDSLADFEAHVNAQATRSK